MSFYRHRNFNVKNHAAITLNVCERNATFSSFDLSTMAIQDVEFCSELVQEVGSMGRIEEVRLIPFKISCISELDKLMLYPLMGKHVENTVISYGNPTSVVKMLQPIPKARFKSTAKHPLVGGLSDLGRSTLQWLVSISSIKAVAKYRWAYRLPASSIAFGLITEIKEIGQRDASLCMVSRNGLYHTGELGFLRLLQAAFLESPWADEGLVHR
ncbi:hypothetical protein B0J11DRAFT_596761 [Dendryphion nanum]|uniref:Uncharacterized protein n=1 Tax=Dendryphion nanum TaxID=256645 RepID=A0A9P9EDU5_9PLEO|nr:hypothetical protein B0J11DRAFT_596761 [Dendryphion nanum]